MLRTRIAKAYIKRTFRPTYGWTQMTPKSVFLDEAWDRSVPIFPGMGMMKTLGENVTLLGTSTDKIPYGFSALYVGGDGIDEPLDAGINAFAVWVMSPDAEAEILAPAFDNTLTFVDSGNGTENLLYVQTTGTSRGKIVPAGTSGASVAPIARLLKVNSPTKLTIGGLR